MGEPQPIRSGDLGQRFEVRATGYPRKVETTIGWCETVEDLEQFKDALKNSPGCKSIRIIDRKK